MTAPDSHHRDRAESAGNGPGPATGSASDPAASDVGGACDDTGVRRDAPIGGVAGAGVSAGRRGLGRFSPAVRTKLHAARLWIMINRPYYCRALFACPLIPTVTEPTMTISMDRRWRIFVNPHYVASCSVEKTAAVLIHEINHALRAHAERSLKTASPATMKFWLAACELEINDDLQDDGLDIDDGLLPHRFNLAPYQTAEAYHQQLLDAAATIDDGPVCGPVCGGHPDHRGHRQLDRDGSDGLSDLQRWLIRRATARTILEDDDDWDVPAGLRDWAKTTAGATVNWRQVLARGAATQPAHRRRCQRLHLAAATAPPRPRRLRHTARAGRARRRHHRRVGHLRVDDPSRAPPKRSARSTPSCAKQSQAKPSESSQSTTTTSTQTSGSPTHDRSPPQADAAPTWPPASRPRHRPRPRRSSSSPTATHPGPATRHQEPAASSPRSPTTT